jgi:RNA polymerase primary sigma factor
MSLRKLTISTNITNRDSTSIKKYLNEVSKLRTVTPEEEVQLGLRIQDGDQQALNELVQANLRFVISVAKQFQYKGIPLCDLINEGNIGLIEAAKRFDATRGFKFISFAVWWIRQYILQSIANSGRTIRMPFNKVNQLNQVARKSAELEQQLERSPNSLELAEALAMEIGDLEDLLSQSHEAVSLDTPLSDDEGATMADLLENKDAIYSDNKVHYYESLKTEVKRVLSILNSKQQQVIHYYFGIGMDISYGIDEIAGRMNLSRERVRQIRDKAIERLQASERMSLLRGFL